MNSPDHKANILNPAYHDIGFGIVNIANYQSSGPQTLVDAMYGSLAGEAVVAAAPQSQTPAKTQLKQSTASTTPANSTTQSSNPTAPATQPVNTPLATTQPSTTQLNTTQLTATPTTIANHTPATTEPPQQQITHIQLVAAGSTTSGVLLVVVFGCAAFAFLLIRHGIAWRKTLARGEKFVLHHPTLDIVASVVIVACVILTRASGLIR
jgi:hypothetical protein